MAAYDIYVGHGVLYYRGMFLRPYQIDFMFLGQAKSG